METLNFCRQIRKQIEDMKLTGMYDRLRTHMPTTDLHTLLEPAVKFTLPMNGLLIEDKNFRALDEIEDLRLPYPIVALEFQRDPAWYDDYTPGGLSDEVRWPTKIVLLLIESKAHISLATWSYAMGHWFTLPPVLIPQKNALYRNAAGEVQVAVRAPSDEAMGPYAARKTDLMNDSQAEVTVLLAFLNALACSNVNIEKLPPRKSGKKLGALPFDEYHVLSVLRSSGGGVNHAHADHRSPREHLRRGHIRRLQSGSKIWVNAAVINAGSSGKIHKQYALA